MFVHFFLILCANRLIQTWELGINNTKLKPNLLQAIYKLVPLAKHTSQISYIQSLFLSICLPLTKAQELLLSKIHNELHIQILKFMFDQYLLGISFFSGGVLFLINWPISLHLTAHPLLFSNCHYNWSKYQSRR